LYSFRSLLSIDSNITNIRFEFVENTDKNYSRIIFHFTIGNIDFRVDFNGGSKSIIFDYLISGKYITIGKVNLT
jgi:hypothetical protein